MLKHTPGTWIAHRFEGQSDYTVYVTGATIAKVPLRNVSIVQQRENAKLIAMAPKLLEFVTAYMGDTLSCDMITDMADLLVENTKD